jgi:LmbE family N-acetylglucosaminyl deacetylase
MLSISCAIDQLLQALPDVAEVYLPHDSLELNADHRLTGQIAAERLAVAGLAPNLFKYVVWDEEVEAGFGYRNRLAVSDDGETANEQLIQVDISAQLERKFLAFMKHATQTTLFVPNQDRTVVPPVLFNRVKSMNVEEFWVLKNS